jgi:hypothetical protein
MFESQDIKANSWCPDEMRIQNPGSTTSAVAKSLRGKLGWMLPVLPVRGLTSHPPSRQPLQPLLHLEGQKLVHLVPLARSTWEALSEQRPLFDRTRSSWLFLLLLPRWWRKHREIRWITVDGTSWKVPPSPSTTKIDLYLSFREYPYLTLSFQYCDNPELFVLTVNW